MRRIVIRLHKLREVLWPLGLLFRGQGSKQIMQRAIESLALCVATGVVRSGPGLLDTIELRQGFHQLRFKVPTLVTVDLLGDPVALKPLVKRHLGHFPCLLVARRYGLGELRENIGENKNINFSRPSLAISNFMNSVARSSRERLASRRLEAVWSTGARPIVHRSQLLM